MKYNLSKRVLSLILTLCMVLAFLPGTIAQASETPATYSQISADFVRPSTSEQVPEEEAEDTPLYNENDQVRVFIVLDGKSTIEKGYTTTDIASNKSAMHYAEGLAETQDVVARRISKEALSGKDLEVRWNLTLVANAMSANVRYGDISAIERVKGVKAVHIAPVYEVEKTLEAAEPNTVSAGGMVGSYDAWLEGYTGAGSRIAIIDTGIDPDHPSFDSKAFEYGLMVSSAKSGMELSDYNLLDEEAIASVLPKLHASAALEGLTAKQLHVNSKIAYGFNYIDESLNISHDLDTQGDHGSHVSGIATANRYVPVAGENGISYAHSDSGVVGIAPDAQILTMKVFGVGGGAYPDDYMAAIEDAIVLNCDTVNLSLGSPTIGFSYDEEEYINEIMTNLSKTETVVTMSCGNSGYWAEYSNSPTGLNYADDANTNRVGSPGSYQNSLAVASVDNNGATGSYIQIKGTNFVYNDNATIAFKSLDISEDQSGTDYPYIFLGNPADPADTVKYAGSLDDFQGLDLNGKIVLVSRGGGIDFTVKQKNALDAGATGLIVYNNEPGRLNMQLAHNLPTVSIQLAQFQTILTLSEKDAQGRYTGTLRVMHGSVTDMDAGGDTIVMSEFSSWGVPGDLTLKPEITAPGGYIYSTRDGGTYGLMSGTSMAAPSVTGMAAVVGQFVRENKLAEQEGITARSLVNSLLMGTAVPSMDYNSDVEFSPRSQGAGLASVVGAVTSPTYITMQGNNDGKVKAELFDDPDRAGQYSFVFHVNNLTDKPTSYQLEASVLAPGILEQDGNRFMRTSDVSLDADVAFTGEAPFDFNGDGNMDEADVLAILCHVSGTAPLTGDALQAADLDGSGAVEAVDAQILNNLLNGGSYGELTLQDLLDQSAITVPAHGTVTVTVTIALTQAGRTYLEENFPNGTYVEGYVYLRAQADQEGVVAVDQSIPFLGYYGNWTDPSMLDRFKYAEDYFDRDAHAPYLPFSIENYYTKQFKDVSTAYYFGVNIYSDDDAYIGDRNALSSAAGDSIYNLTYQLVRNAANVNFAITDAETGEVYFQQDYGKQYSAFYYTNGGAWMYTRTNKTINWAGTDAEGNPLPNNAKVNMTLTMVPEYNMGPDGVLKGQLGKGATWTMPLTIDNESPDVETMYFSSDAITDAKLLNVQAKDNQYIAAVRVYNEAGTKLLGAVSPNQTKAGTDVTMHIDMSEIHADNVMVAVVDYAGNTAAYSLELGNGGGDTPEAMTGFFAYLPAQSSWINFEETTANNPTPLAESAIDYGAAEQVNGYVFATDLNGYLYVMEHGKYEPTVICQTSYNAIQDMAYNAANEKLYGLTAVTLEDGTIRSNIILEIDMLSGAIKELGQIELEATKDSLQTLACTEDGVFYAVTSSDTESMLYSFTINESGLSAPRLVGGTGYQANYIQSMTCNRATGDLYWAQFFKPGIFSQSESHLLKLDKTTGKATAVSELVNETTGLYYVSKAGQSFGDTDKVTDVQLIQSDITLYSGRSQALEGYVLPWTLSDRSIVWSSSNSAVASVTKDGVVTGVKAGTAVITAAAKLDPLVKATCSVTVKEIDKTVNGIVYGSDNKASFAKINVDDATYTKLSGPLNEDFISATMLGDTLYAATDSALYTVDPDNGFTTKKVGTTAAPFTDMTYSPHMGFGLATYGYNLFVVDPEEEGCLHSYWNLSSLFNSINGVTYAGYDSTYEYFYLLSSSGSLYLVGIYEEGSGYTLTLLDIISTDLSISGQDRNQSIIYDFESGWIFWTRYDGEDGVSIVAVNEETEEVVVRGSFPSGVWPVVGLYATGNEDSMDRTGDNLTRSPMTSFANAECPIGNLKATPSVPQTVLKH